MRDLGANQRGNRVMVIETKRLIITTASQDEMVSFISTGTVLLFRNKHRDEINMGTETKGPSLLVFHEVTK